MIGYIAHDGTERQEQDIYQVSIEQDIAVAGKTAVKGFRAGWFPSKPPDPAAVFYMLGSPVGEYFANVPTSVSFQYYFEVRSFDREKKEAAAKALCSAVSQLYHGRRGQYDDSFDGGAYVKRITFTFTVKIKELI